MAFIPFHKDWSKAKIGILIKTKTFYSNKLIAHYIKPTKLDKSLFFGFDLKYNKNNTTNAKLRKEYIDILLPEIKKLNLKILLVADGNYFKTLTGKTKTTPYYNYFIDCKYKDYEDIKILLIPNYQAILHNPAIQNTINKSLICLVQYINGCYVFPGKDIIKYEAYPETPERIKYWLNKLLDFPQLTCDIETTSLQFWETDIETISFAWNMHEGIAFNVNRGKYSKEVKQLLKQYFCSFNGQLIYHNAGFDTKVLIYNLWMKHLSDYEGMLEGLHIIFKNTNCTLIISYLATNNTIQNILSLKKLAADYVGNYALTEIEDISQVKDSILLRYNLKDCLATWYVYEKYYPIMKQDNQLYIYETIFKPAMKTLCQMELCGIIIDKDRVLEVEKQLQDIKDNCLNILCNSPIIKEFHYIQIQKRIEAFTEKAKKKIYTEDDTVIKSYKFNPNSDTQIRKLLFDHLGYNVTAYTKTKLPSVSADALKSIKPKKKEHKELLDNLLDLAKVNIILSTFIPAFKNAQQLQDGTYRLYGNFKLGGTISLRISSKNPNLMNLPSNSHYGSLIKSCFISNQNWLFTGADYSSLEDRVNALQTKDPNKLVIYTEGYDAHCFRTYAYWKDQMNKITEALNKIKPNKKYYKIINDDDSITYSVE